MSFNPHTHAGCDYDFSSYICSQLVSIHTPTQGVTVIAFLEVLLLASFNPHTHAGCDSENLKVQQYSFMFQSTHPRRV